MDCLNSYHPVVFGSLVLPFPLAPSASRKRQVFERADDQERGNPVPDPAKNSKINKNEDHAHERGDPSYSKIPEWLQEFKESLVDGSVSEHRDSPTGMLLAEDVLMESYLAQTKLVT